MFRDNQRSYTRDRLTPWGIALSNPWLQYSKENRLLTRPAEHEDLRSFMAGGPMSLAMRDRWSEGYPRLGSRRMNPNFNAFIPGGKW
jgi:hypothetical protein